MNKSESIKELATALASAQGEITNTHKDKQGHNYKYADLAQCLDVARPILSKHGLSIVQMPSNADQQVTLETILMHKSGEWISDTIQMTVEKGRMSMAQAVGSVITYARRYALTAFVGIAQDDNDAAVMPAATPTVAPTGTTAAALHIVPPVGDRRKIAKAALLKHFGNADAVKTWMESMGLPHVDSATPEQLDEIGSAFTAHKQSAALDKAMA